jgi:hypothetical protein
MVDITIALFCWKMYSQEIKTGDKGEGEETCKQEEELFVWSGLEVDSPAIIAIGLHGRLLWLFSPLQTIRRKQYDRNKKEEESKSE